MQPSAQRVVPPLNLSRGENQRRRAAREGTGRSTTPRVSVESFAALILTSAPARAGALERLVRGPEQVPCESSRSRAQTRVGVRPYRVRWLTLFACVHVCWESLSCELGIS